MSISQSGILEPLCKQARYLSFALLSDTDPRACLRALAENAVDNDCIVGIGASLVANLDCTMDGLHTFPVFEGSRINLPSTPASLWLWLRGADRGELIHRTRFFCELLDDAFECTDIVDSFKYGEGLDLTGFVDGTENPQAEQAADAALLRSSNPDLTGSSFVAVQQWLHDLDYMLTLSETEQDLIIGRNKKDDKEIQDAPSSAHVKRTAQESFTPEAFIVRRSMPWADADNEGLMFVAFGKSFDAYEDLLKNMLGLNDNIIDDLFRFSTPISGAYYWCPPVKHNRLNLAALGL